MACLWHRSLSEIVPGARTFSDRDRIGQDNLLPDFPHPIQIYRPGFQGKRQMGMASTKRAHVGWINLALCLCLSICHVSGQPVREKLVTTAVSQLHVREQGYNDGKEVRKYLRSTGLGKGYPWCAAFVAWCHDENNIPNPGSARVVDWFDANVIWQKDWRKNQPEVLPGYVGGLYYEHLGRLGHIFIIEEEDANNYYTIEGNTNRAGSREGDGVYRKIRSKKNVAVLGDYCIKPDEYFNLIEQLYGTDKQN